MRTKTWRQVPDPYRKKVCIARKKSLLYPLIIINSGETLPSPSEGYKSCQLPRGTTNPNETQRGMVGDISSQWTLNVDS